MTWYGWVLIGVYVINALATIYMIGKPREVITPGHATWILAINLLMVIGILTVGT